MVTIFRSFFCLLKGKDLPFLECFGMTNTLLASQSSSFVNGVSGH